MAKKIVGIVVVLLGILAFNVQSADALVISFYPSGTNYLGAADGATGTCGSQLEQCGDLFFADIGGGVSLTINGVDGAGDSGFGGNTFSWYDINPDYGGVGAAQRDDIQSVDNIGFEGEGVLLTFSVPVNLLGFVALNHQSGSSNNYGVGSAYYAENGVSMGMVTGGPLPTLNPLTPGGMSYLIQHDGCGDDPQGPCEFYISALSFLSTTDDPSVDTVVPEPSTLVLFGTGLAFAAYRVRRRRTR